VQTPIQQAIEKLIQFGAGLDTDKQLIVTGCIIRLHNLLATEQEVIMDAYYDGWNGFDNNSYNYFTTKFNNKN
jgi:hypothetical protein